MTDEYLVAVVPASSSDGPWTLGLSTRGRCQTAGAQALGAEAGLGLGGGAELAAGAPVGDTGVDALADRLDGCVAPPGRLSGPAVYRDSAGDRGPFAAAKVRLQQISSGFDERTPSREPTPGSCVRGSSRHAHRTSLLYTFPTPQQIRWSSNTYAISWWSSAYCAMRWTRASRSADRRHGSGPSEPEPGVAAPILGPGTPRRAER